MEVEYTESNYRGEDSQDTESIANLLYDEILNEDRRGGHKEKIHLEEQPRKVVEAMGRLVEILLDKNVLDLNDLKYITGLDWGVKADSLKLKKEE